MTNAGEKNKTSLFFVGYRLNALWIKRDIDRKLDSFPHTQLSCLGFLQTITYFTYFTSSVNRTSDAGLRMGGQRHLTPSLSQVTNPTSQQSTPLPNTYPPHTHDNNYSIINAHFSRFQLERDGRTNGRTNGASYKKANSTSRFFVVVHSSKRKIVRCKSGIFHASH